jgi:flagellar hook-length control protein FliK
VAQHNESTEIVVHLKPAFLGKLSIRVVADEHGMRVEIQAENQVVRQVMQDNLADLQQRLSEKGLTLDQFSVFAEAGSHSERETARSFEEPDNGSPVGASAALGADLAETTSAVSSGGIDYFA